MIQKGPTNSSRLQNTMTPIEEFYARTRGEAVESCCDGGRCKVETEGVDLRPDTYPYELSTSGALKEKDTSTSYKPSVNLSEQQTIEERHPKYGRPEINLPAIGKHWTAILMQAWGKADLPDIDGRVVAQMMAALKLSRLARSPGHEDSEHDLRTYLTIAKSLTS